MDVSPAVIAVISLVLSSGNVDPSTSHPNVPLLVLQLKVAVDPSVALTDVAVLVKAEIMMRHACSLKVSMQMCMPSHS